VSFTVCTQLWTKFLIFRSGLSDIRINCSRIIEGLLDIVEGTAPSRT
jgi:hypothetical protein